jgi:hypothetical protein
LVKAAFVTLYRDLFCHIQKSPGLLAGTLYVEFG